MPSRTPGDERDPAAELLGRWQAHHSVAPESTADVEAHEELPADPSSAPTVEGTTPGEAGVRSDAGPPTKPGQRRPTPPRGADQTEAGREVIEALGITPPTPTPSAPHAPTVVATPSGEPVAKRRSREPVPTGQTTDVEFVPRTLLRHVLGITLLLLVPLTAAVCYLAYDERETLSVGLAGTLVILLLVVYAVRAASTPARLAIHSGQLEVVRGSTREVFDLTSRFTRLEVVGKPGRPGWKVLMGRFGRDPLVIDSSMVDPTKFTAALERHRPRSR